MIDFILGALIGLFVGGFFGVIVTCCLVATGRRDDLERPKEEINE